MSRYRSDIEMGDYQKPSACSNFLHYTWKTITCILSHVTLISMVIAYCALGAFTFEALEVENEKNVKQNISKIRCNITKKIWNLTLNTEVLESDFFINGAMVYLKEFEAELLNAMTREGWDGEEDDTKVQWSRQGALFYSIIVITTIGYGHIAPKTKWGKVVTIFYAILGIPLMLLCLSNIGDIMATSFRFLYWRVCCYVCTKRAKKRDKNRSFRGGSKGLEVRYSRSRQASFRRSVRTSTRSADSGFALSETSPYSHSETDLRAHPEFAERSKRGSSLPRMRPSQTTSRFSDSTAPKTGGRNRTQLGGSLDRRKFPKGMLIELDPILLARTPILCNKYVVGKGEVLPNMAPGITLREMEGQGMASPLTSRRAKSLPRNQHYLEPPPRLSPPPPLPQDHLGDELKHRPRKRRSPNPSPKMMTPLGYGHRSKYLDDPDSDEEDYYMYDDESYEISRSRAKPVPIWLCVFLVVSYIVAGAFLFQSWEEWDFLNAAYFCFITLTTIGFGDLVPARGTQQNEEKATVSIALCSLYLLFGIALLAMSFNLVQEEVISNVKSVAKMLGIIKKEQDDSEDEM